MVARLQYLWFCLFEIYVNVVFVIRCLYSAVSLTLVKEQRFIRVIIILHPAAGFTGCLHRHSYNRTACFCQLFWASQGEAVVAGSLRMKNSRRLAKDVYLILPAHIPALLMMSLLLLDTTGMFSPLLFPIFDKLNQKWDRRLLCVYV